MLLYNPEERSPILHRDKILKSRKLLIISVRFMEMIFIVMRLVDLYLRPWASRSFMIQYKFWPAIWRPIS